MEENKTLFVILSVYLTEVTGACNFYMFFSSTEANNYGYIELWAWLALATASFLAVHWFLQRSPSLGQLVALSVGCYVVTVAVMSEWFIHVNGMAAWVAAWAFLAYPVVRMCILNLSGNTISELMVRCELPAFGIALLLWMDEGGVYHLPTYYAVVSVAVLALTILALTTARMHRPDSAPVPGQGAAVATTAVGLVGLGFLGWLGSKVATVGAAKTVATTTSFVALVLDWVLGILSALWLWLLSLIPQQEVVPYELEIETAVMEEELLEMAAGDPGMILLVMGLGVLALVLWVAWWLFRLRKLRLAALRLPTPYRRPKQVVAPISLWARLKAALARLGHWVQFWCHVIAKRNTPQGNVILLERLGKMKGMGRHTGESYHTYLLRLSTLCQGQMTQDLTALAKAVDGALYAPQGTDSALSAKTHRALRRGMVTMTKVKAKEPSVSVQTTSCSCHCGTTAPLSCTNGNSSLLP